MEITIGKKEYRIDTYPSNIEIFEYGENGGRIASITCTGDEPVILSGKKYTRGIELGNAIDKYNLKKLVNRFN